MSVPLAALVVLFVLTATPVRVVALQFVCHSIRTGDTAALLAQRLTGDPKNRHQPWFRIVDPTTPRVISKSHYHLIRPGWLACVALASSEHLADRAGNQAANLTPVRQATSLQGSLEAIDLVFVGCWAAFCLLITWLLWSVSERYLQEAHTTFGRMKLFGDLFIKEFERPLAQSGYGGRPIRSRVRYMPHRRRLDILLAPGTGHHYPNLSDHKKNVEYDVARIVRDLRHEAFVSGRLHAQGPWVVIPFEFTPNSQTEGAQ